MATKAEMSANGTTDHRSALSAIVNRQWRFAPTRDGEAAALRQRQSSVV